MTGDPASAGGRNRSCPRASGLATRGSVKPRPTTEGAVPRDDRPRQTSPQRARPGAARRAHGRRASHEERRDLPPARRAARGRRRRDGPRLRLVPQRGRHAAADRLVPAARRHRRPAARRRSPRDGGFRRRRPGDRPGRGRLVDPRTARGPRTRLRRRRSTSSSSPASPSTRTAAASATEAASTTPTCAGSPSRRRASPSPSTCRWSRRCRAPPTTSQSDSSSPRRGCSAQLTRHLGRHLPDRRHERLVGGRVADLVGEPGRRQRLQTRVRRERDEAPQRVDRLVEAGALGDRDETDGCAT